MLSKGDKQFAERVGAALARKSKSTPAQLAALIESMAENPKGSARAAYLHCARLIRDHLAG